MEDKVAKQIIDGFLDVRLNTTLLAWTVKLRATPHIDNMMKEFFYYYTAFRNQDTYANDAAWMGEKLMESLSHPDHQGLSTPPPPGTRVVFDG